MGFPKQAAWLEMGESLLYASLKKWFVAVGMNSGYLVMEDRCLEPPAGLSQLTGKPAQVEMDVVWYSYNFETLELHPVYLVKLEVGVSAARNAGGRHALKALCRSHRCAGIQVRVGSLADLDERLDRVSYDHWRFASVVLGKKDYDDESRSMFFALRHLFSYDNVNHKILCTIDSKAMNFHDVPAKRFAWWLDFYSDGNLLKLVRSGLTLEGRWKLSDMLSAMSIKADGTFMLENENPGTGNAAFEKHWEDERTAAFLKEGSIHARKRMRRCEGFPPSGHAGG